MDLAAILALQVLGAIANLVLICLGLAVIFGMMRIINLAHGEFIMLGGYTVLVATGHGVNFWIAVFVLAPLVVGAIGLIVERLVIRRLYGRMIDALLASWGISLLFIGLVTAIFGNTTTSQMAPPFAALHIGDYSIGGYEIFLIVVASVLVAALWAGLRFTKAGLIARGTLQNRDMAAALGVDPARVYMATFALGAALSGLAGALLAPLVAVLPTMGAAFIAKAFITVISGGGAVIAGTVGAAGVLGGLNSIVSTLSTPVIGEVALLLAALILLRFLPHGLTGRPPGESS